MSFLLLSLFACTKGNDDTGAPDADGDGVRDLVDCAPDDPEIFQGQEERCNQIDDDCDGQIDEGLRSPVYHDGDQDGFGDPHNFVEACGPSAEWVEDSSDCDDADADVHPGATEDDCADPVDYNCDGSVQYEDADNDGWAACEDCDDHNSTLNPDQEEVCDFLDNDCDGDVDEDDAVDASTFYADADLDGFGDASSTTTACAVPPGYSAFGTDCDDGDEQVYPGAREICDGKDSDCQGGISEALVPGDYASIQDAINAAEPWVCVEPGTYTERIDFGGQDLVVESIAGADSTTIDGDGVGPVVTFATAESSAAVLRGFTITGGSLDDAGYGAGVYIESADPTLEELIISGNVVTDTTSTFGGGGLYAVDSSFVLVDSRLDGNEVTGGSFGGGGVMIDGGSDPLFERVVFSGNVVDDSTAWGGGFHCRSSSFTLQNVAFYGNEVHSDNQLTGSALSTVYCTGSVTNLVAAGNLAVGSGGKDYGGAVFFAYTGDIELVNASITGNSSDAATAYNGGGLEVFYGPVVAVNLDLSDNSSAASTLDSSAGIGCLYGVGTLTVSTSNLYGNTVGTGTYACDDSVWSDNLAADPGYTDTSSSDPESWDLSLATGSALIDAGDPAILDADGTTSDIGAMGGPLGGDW